MFKSLNLKTLPYESKSRSHVVICRNSFANQMKYSFTTAFQLSNTLSLIHPFAFQRDKFLFPGFL